MATHNFGLFQEKQFEGETEAYYYWKLSSNQALDFRSTLSFSAGCREMVSFKKKKKKKILEGLISRQKKIPPREKALCEKENTTCELTLV